MELIRRVITEVVPRIPEGIDAKCAEVLKTACI